MTWSSDILYMTEYIKNVLYFATARPGKVIKSTDDTFYFCIDNDLVYENYYSDFGPLNLGCVYKYCKMLNDELNLSKQKIVHYTSIDPKKKANSAFLLGCYGVLYLNLSPKDALKPLTANGQNYRPFQDATQGDSSFTISLLDCLQAIKKARDLGFFNFQDFDYEEYDRLDKIQGGDLNWIVPGKFLAFIGPVDYSVSIYHPPEMYVDYFLENNVNIVIRLNKKLYDGNVFSNAGIIHYDLFFPDGSYPPRNILWKFLQISEESDGAIAVHCKAGLGRTGSLIGCYLIKHYAMTAHEAIGWMRICRPGSVIGHQQGWLEQLEPWLLKQGYLYRKRYQQDAERLPIHKFGVYSKKKAPKQRPVICHKSSSQSMQKQTRTDLSPPSRQQTSASREDGSVEEEEIFITSCDLTTPSQSQMIQMKGCVMKNRNVNEECDINDEHLRPKVWWKKYFCCHHYIQCVNDNFWDISVRCAKIAPKTCYANRCCIFLDKVAVSKAPQSVPGERGHMRYSRANTSQYNCKSDNKDSRSVTRRGSGGDDPTAMLSRVSTNRTPRNSAKSQEATRGPPGPQSPLPSFRTSQGPVIKTINDARNFLVRSTVNREERGRQLNSTIIVTPHHSRVRQYHTTACKFGVPNIEHAQSTFNSASMGPTQPLNRRKLGRSPSPPKSKKSEQTRATNTVSSAAGKFLVKDASKTTLRDVLSRLKLVTGREGSVGAASVGAASLGARREAPIQKRAPSVRSDERTSATQGDMLNCIKFQRRLGNSMQSEKLNSLILDKMSMTPKEGTSIKDVNSKTSTATKRSHHLNNGYSLPKDRTNTMSRGFFPTPRPSSPIPRRNSRTRQY